MYGAHLSSGYQGRLRYDSFTSVVDNCLKVTGSFLSHHHPKAILEKCMAASNVQFGKTLKDPGDTKGCSHFRVVDAVSNARLAFHNLVFIDSEEAGKECLSVGQDHSFTLKI